MAATLAGLAADLVSGVTTSEALVEFAIAAIEDPTGQGAESFVGLDRGKVLAAARASDMRRKSGRPLSRHDGIPFSVKDLFDLAGETTKAGSKVLANAPPAIRDAASIARLKNQGFVILGRTNMTEFAYSGVGLNPHYGTPLSVYDRATGRIPGGSSSGAAVSVADGFCPLGIGTDTGGSCRIPAAYNGIVGYKSSTGRVSKEGCYPLSRSFDSIGPLANTVACCATADSIMAGDWDGAPAPRFLQGLRAARLANFVTDNLDPEVARDFERVLTLLSSAGVKIDDVTIPGLENLPSLNARGGIVGAEAFAQHAEQILEKGDEYDPRVRSRIALAEAMTPDELTGLFARQREMKIAFAALMQNFDMLLLPAVAIVPPPVADLADDRDYARYNALSLRNTYVINFLDGCAISLPMHRQETAPTGLMLAAPHLHDQQLFSIASSVEALLRR
jgi:aspartyl-tRNA(Asn)/glutamyl-tRNA(Gln) amidotransferase subunit A